jgi:hypothetical protein
VDRKIASFSIVPTSARLGRKRHAVQAANGLSPMIATAPLPLPYWVSLITSSKAFEEEAEGSI